MTQPPPLPTLIATSVVRGSDQGESHGGIYLLDLAAQEIRQVVDWNTANIDWQGRGWDRGLRGIAFFKEEVYVAASDELFIYNRDFQLQRSYRNPYLKHCHEIHVSHNHLFLTSTGHDSILAFDLERQAFFWAVYLTQGETGPQAIAYNPLGNRGPGGSKGPVATNQLHLNNVFVDDTGLYTSGLRSGAILRVGSDNTARIWAELPEGTHNARPFRDGALYNDTASNLVRYDRRDGSAMTYDVPQYDADELTHLDLGDERVARQGFGRGLCVIDERFIAAGSSPSTVSVLDLSNGQPLLQVNFSQDIRNAIHGLEVWPY